MYTQSKNRGVESNKPISPGALSSKFIKRIAHTKSTIISFFFVFGFGTTWTAICDECVEKKPFLMTENVWLNRFNDLQFIDGGTKEKKERCGKYGIYRNQWKVRP